MTTQPPATVAMTSAGRAADCPWSAEHQYAVLLGFPEAKQRLEEALPSKHDWEPLLKNPAVKLVKGVSKTIDAIGGVAEMPTTGTLVSATKVWLKVCRASGNAIAFIGIAIGIRVSAPGNAATKAPSARHYSRRFARSRAAVTMSRT
jgi:hypothetical protein